MGAACYLFFRENGLAILRYSRGYPQPDHPVGVVVIGSLPDFFWDFSFCNALLLYAGAAGWRFRKGLILSFLLVVASEVLQLLTPRSFTFDFWDLAAAVLAFLLSTAIQLLLKRKSYAE